MLLKLLVLLAVAMRTLAKTKKDSEEIILKNNDPYQCRCGEMITRDAPGFLDIESVNSDTQTENPDSTTAENKLLDANDTVVVIQYSAGKTKKMNKTNIRTDVNESDFQPYVPKNRPWLVVIRLEREDKTFVECTGSILSKSWIISSKSCFCGDKFGCNVTARVANYSGTYAFPAKEYTVGSDVKTLNKTDYPFLIRNLNAIQIPMQDKNKIKNDVVMVKVDMPFVWSDDVMPICLPQGNFSSDEYQKVFINGFNFHFHRKVAQADKCQTVAGPRKATCKHYLKQDEPSIFKGCNFATTIRAEECLMLQRFMNWSTMLPNDLKSLIIKKNISQIDTKERERRFPNQTQDIVSIPCFDENPGAYGWCGTCLSEAGKGEPGYCGDDKAQEGESLYHAELSRPSEFGGWGFCDKVCQTAQKARGNELPVLLETMRLVESSEDCQKHMQLKIDADFMHLCVVAQQLAHKQIIYRMINETMFEKDDQEDSMISTPLMSSIGDAGAPIFSYVNEKLNKDGSTTGIANAVLLGILSTNQYDPVTDANPKATAFSKMVEIKELITRVKPLLIFIKNTLKNNTLLDSECFTNE